MVACRTPTHTAVRADRTGAPSVRQAEETGQKVLSAWLRKKCFRREESSSPSPSSLVWKGAVAWLLIGNMEEAPDWTPGSPTQDAAPFPQQPRRPLLWATQWEGGPRALLPSGLDFPSGRD